jgi:hypothetical protein
VAQPPQSGFEIIRTQIISLTFSLGALPSRSHILQRVSPNASVASAIAADRSTTDPSFPRASPPSTICCSSCPRICPAAVGHSTNVRDRGVEYRGSIFPAVVSSSFEGFAHVAFTVPTSRSLARILPSGPIRRLGRRSSHSGGDVQDSRDCTVEAGELKRKTRDCGRWNAGLPFSYHFFISMIE